MTIDKEVMIFPWQAARTKSHTPSYYLLLNEDLSPRINIKLPLKSL